MTAMDYAILLYFDQVSDRILQDWIDQLVAAGVNPSYQKTGMRPHLTIAEVDARHYEPLMQRLTSLSEQLPALSLRLASIGLFPNPEGVLFLAPIVDEALLAFHRIVNEAIEPLSDAFSPLYLEENWVPHCTLALDMRPEEIDTAYRVMQQVFKMVEVRISQIGIIECCPYREKFVSPIRA